jgi:hypothetical protein
MREIFTKEELLNAIPTFGKVNATLIQQDGYKSKVRLARAMGGTSIIKMSYRSKRYGSPVRFENYSHVFIQEENKTPVEVKWEKAWRKVLARLEKSGLYEGYRRNVEIALAVGYAKVNEAYKADHADWNQTTEEKQASLDKLDPRLVGTREDGTRFINTEIIWYMHQLPKVKKMYFGKYVTESYLEQIKTAMENKTPIRLFRTVGYDVSIEYNPEANKAWYSEQYRGCGNGHYYLALDATHAIFYEDD